MLHFILFLMGRCYPSLFLSLVVMGYFLKQKDYKRLMLLSPGLVLLVMACLNPQYWMGVYIFCAISWLYLTIKHFNSSWLLKGLIVIVELFCFFYIGAVILFMSSDSYQYGYIRVQDGDSQHVIIYIERQFSFFAVQQSDVTEYLYGSNPFFPVGKYYHDSPTVDKEWGAAVHRNPENFESLSDYLNSFEKLETP